MVISPNGPCKVNKVTYHRFPGQNNNNGFQKLYGMSSDAANNKHASYSKHSSYNSMLLTGQQEIS